MDNCKVKLHITSILKYFIRWYYFKYVDIYWKYRKTQKTFWAENKIFVIYKCIFFYRKVMCKNEKGKQNF